MKKLLLKNWGRISILVPLIILMASFAFLSQRAVFAKRIDLSTYKAQTHAQQYFALPYSGANFKINSTLGYIVGRYYLKGNVAATVLAAYEHLASKHPQWQFIYAEMGKKGGGPFRPHRTHRQGMSADFITPVYILDDADQKIPAVLPVGITNLWGYYIRLDNQGRFQAYHLDTTATIAHLVALKNAGAIYGVRIKQVIFDPPLLALLRADPTFKQLRGIRFMEGKAWFPHDGHYHVDFEALPL